MGGGGILNAANLSLTNSTISGNTAGSPGGVAQGGGILNWGGKATLTDSTISGNTAATAGGGIYNEDTLFKLNNTIPPNSTVTNSTVPANVVGSIILTNSTISDNAATNSYGGGIWNGDGNVILTNNTISGNTADRGNGGGIYNSGGDISITFGTIYGNSAFTGGGISTEDDDGGPTYKFHASFVVKNSLVAGNHSDTSSAHVYLDPDVDGPLISDGYNLFQNALGITFRDPNRKHSSDLSGYQLTDLKIDPKLAGTRSSTLVHALLAGSPAIDQIPLNACRINSEVRLTDQRGTQRPQGSKCDIGAYEYVFPS